MWIVFMVIDGDEYIYGRYLDRNQANEVALFVQEQRNCETFVISDF